MTGWTPVPDKLRDKLFKLAKKSDKRSAVELYLLSQTCRKAGWEGLMPGQIKVTESQLAEIIGTNKSYAHRLLTSIMAEVGLVRGENGILTWDEPKKGPTLATIEPLKTLGKLKPEGPKKGPKKGAASIYHRDKSITATKPSIENILENNGQSLVSVFWRLSAVFGKGKNLKARDAATAFRDAVQAGNDPELIILAAEYTISALSDQKYAPQLVSWLEQESYLAGSVQIIPTKEYKRVNDE